MNPIKSSLRFLGVACLACIMFTGCKSSDGNGSASASVYYGMGFYDPWYYGDYYDDVDVIVTPPERPVAPPHPAHPIVTPAPVAPRPTPMPSIPSMPRPSMRR